MSAVSVHTGSGGRLVAWVAVLAGLGAGCGAAPPESPGNVVLVCIDQLRKDSAEAHMPELEALARDGVVFEDMRAAAPWTYPSVVSLLSGLYPQQHGADGQLQGLALSRFDPELPLVQKVLGAAGYATAAFITNPFLLDWNALHRGFDSFDAHFIGELGSDADVSKTWRSETMFADSVNAAIRAHYDDQVAATPEFTYVHYIDVHGPWQGAPFPKDYRSAVRFVDQKVAELHAYFRDRYDGEMLFFVTSDHGRALGDDATVGYGAAWRKDKHSVHDFNLRIPFLILPSRELERALSDELERTLSGPRRISGPASNVDFVPTLLDWLGLSSPVPLPGISLLPAIRGEAALPAERSIYARSSAFGSLNNGLVYRGRKYIQFFDVDSGRLVKRRIFDLRADPRETVSVGDGFGEVAERMREASGDRGLSYPATFERTGPEVEERLRALGYLEGVSPAKPPRESDPRITR